MARTYSGLYEWLAEEGVYDDGRPWLARACPEALRWCRRRRGKPLDVVFDELIAHAGKQRVERWSWLSWMFVVLESVELQRMHDDTPYNASAGLCWARHNRDRILPAIFAALHEAGVRA